MWTLLKWFFIGWVLLLILSDIELSTSIYRYQDNKVDIAFPRWESKHPWATFSWHAGETRFHWYGLDGKPLPADSL
ncbi:hypothetical protein ACW5WQ_15135 [Aeromonas rivuli]|jgi:hypothetical protein|uniref:hypothetical protein n=1 Tax=Aeromonas TaxID=642 RepID=UPI0005A7A2D4|nr:MULTISPECIES: hypothetical protein [Aeromonas]MCS3461678.1 hypothetical protein [Aeromonas sp. BIGb0445]UBO74660.1 hypothetical protein KYK33_03485 [Aeromonas rivuli]